MSLETTIFDKIVGIQEDNTTEAQVRLEEIILRMTDKAIERVKSETGDRRAEHDFINYLRNFYANHQAVKERIGKYVLEIIEKEAISGFSFGSETLQINLVVGYATAAFLGLAIQVNSIPLMAICAIALYRNVQTRDEILRRYQTRVQKYYANTTLIKNSPQIIAGALENIRDQFNEKISPLYSPQTI